MINNEYYHFLHDAWYHATNHPIALLRAENQVRIPWIQNSIKEHYQEPVQVLDVGCGAGFLTNALVKEAHDITGIDVSESSLQIATKFDSTKKVKYIQANAYELPFNEASFDVVCATDVLEHVEKPEKLIEEASRVLKPGGIFFFHTFNRTFLSYLFVIKGMDWVFRNPPDNIHVYELFITPSEIEKMCLSQDLHIKWMKGFAPKIWQKPFWSLLRTGKVESHFAFHFCDSLKIGYCGYAHKNVQDKK